LMLFYLVAKVTGWLRLIIFKETFK
jgi:hypothetical protein